MGETYKKKKKKKVKQKIHTKISLYFATQASWKAMDSKHYFS